MFSRDLFRNQSFSSSRERRREIQVCEFNTKINNANGEIVIQSAGNVEIQNAAGPIYNVNVVTISSLNDAIQLLKNHSKQIQNLPEGVEFIRTLKETVIEPFDSEITGNVSFTTDGEHNSHNITFTKADDIHADTPRGTNHVTASSSSNDLIENEQVQDTSKEEDNNDNEVSKLVQTQEQVLEYIHEVENDPDSDVMVQGQAWEDENHQIHITFKVLMTKVTEVDRREFVWNCNKITVIMLIIILGVVGIIVGAFKYVFDGET